MRIYVKIQIHKYLIKKYFIIISISYIIVFLIKSTYIYIYDNKKKLIFKQLFT
jgi:hypothetical protein